MALFKKPDAQANLSERDILQNKYKNARSNLLLVVAFSLVNSVMCLFGSSSYFLWSASIPYYFTLYGMVYTGRFPAEYYADWPDFVPLGDSYLATMVTTAFVCIGVYLLFWFLSKKHGYGWLAAALAFFVVDTVYMFYVSGFSADMLLDILFHIWVIVTLITGISAALKLKKLPAENTPEMQVAPEQIPFYNAQPQPVEVPYTEAPQETAEESQEPTEAPKED